jgi:threonylcarbamoyladenosine tRNA methylthiotransferase MtaB
LERRTGLVELLKRILDVPGLRRLRLSSIEPMRFSRGIVELALKYRSFARHFHIPLQSGSDRILRQMRRPYRASQFLNLLHHIRANLPDAGIGTDVIVGFPGETENDFQQTCELVRTSPLTYIHVFPFSPREGTDAETMPDRVPEHCIHERARIVRELSLARNLDFRRRFVGQVLPAVTLAEQEEMGESAALTENYIHVRILGMSVPANRLVDVRIDEVGPDMTIGSLAR